MNKAWKSMAQKLPTQPCAALVESILMAIYDNGDLGDAILLYHREAVTLREELQQTMSQEDFARRERTAVHRWGARCTCTNCGEDLIAGYINKNGRKGIVLAEGDDGQTYSGYAEPSGSANEYLEGETVLCPCCWTPVVVTHRSALRRGRTYQVLQAETVNVDCYTVVMYWLVSRHMDDAGVDCTTFQPNSALLIDQEGKLRRFRAQRLGNEVRDVVWTPCTYAADPMQQMYYSWEAANHHKIGGWTYECGPVLDGHTGEKTALDEYIGADGHWPGAYLHVWQKHPQVENLMRSGLEKAVTGAIDSYLDCAAYRGDLCNAPPLPWVDWREVKPHRMLHMSKPAFREIAKKSWSDGTVEVWDRYFRQVKHADALDFESCRMKVGSKGVEQLLEMVAAGWDDLQPLPTVRYLEKQKLLKDGVQHLIDYRKMLRDAHMDETAETLWPRELMAAHERMTQYWSQHHQTGYQLGFTSTYIQYRALEWTDGDLCIVIPQVEQQLVEEGKTLRHCVGTYGDSHCTGRPIFFVRRYRRPERNYYTLQVDMTGTVPKEIQLHGYGNEHHGPAKQYRHGIPAKVRDFCDRWEREVLMPWVAEHSAKIDCVKKKKQKRVYVA